MFTPPVVVSLDAKPYEDIYATVSQCPNICQTLYGIGDTDLTGIGVRPFSPGRSAFLPLGLVVTILNSGY